MKTLPVLALEMVLGLFAVTGLPAQPSNPPTAPWWENAVFYEVFVRSFADSTAGPLANDGIGDLQGLIEHLDYLNDGNPASPSDLGVTALWLMPLHPSPSYHGYDVTDYFQINPDYGDLTTMHRLVTEAHRRGLHVIVDLVLNHASSQHPLFLRAKANPKDQEARNCFRFSPLPLELSGPWDQRVWHPSGREFYYGVFSSGMPDWNFRDPATTQHHHRVAQFWLKEMDVDGFRLDAIRYFFESKDAFEDLEETKTWLRDFTEYCHAIKPGCFLVGECSAPSPIIASYARAHAQDSLFEFGLSRAVFEAVRFEQPGILTQKLAELARAYEGRQPWSSFLANHDQDRTLSQFGGNVDLAKLAAQLEFVLPGTPFIYYGEEIGMTGEKPDEDLRTPMAWTGTLPLAGFSHGTAAAWRALHADAVHANVADETSDPSSLLSLYRRLVRLRLSLPVLGHGEVLPIVVSPDRVFACLRPSEKDWILILANLGANPVRDVEVNLPTSPLSASIAVEEILQHAEVSQPQPGPQGRLTEWKPLAELDPHRVYLIHAKIP